MGVTLIVENIAGERVVTGWREDPNGPNDIFIPFEVKVAASAFRGCLALRKVTMHSSPSMGIMGIGAFAFADCSSLEEVELLPPPPGSTYGGRPVTPSVGIDSCCFQNCVALKKFTIPPKLLSMNIGDFAFQNCKKLKEITIDSFHIKIGDFAFLDCTELQGVEFPCDVSIPNFGPHAFSRCTNLKKFTLPFFTNMLSEGMFANCANLKEINILGLTCRSGVTSFIGCIKLESIIMRMVALGNRVPNNAHVVAFNNSLPQGLRHILKIMDKRRYWYPLPEYFDAIGSDQEQEENFPRAAVAFVGGLIWCFSGGVTVGVDNMLCDVLSFGADDRKHPVKNPRLLLNT